MKTHFLLKYNITPLTRNCYFVESTPDHSSLNPTSATKFSSIGQLLKAYALRSPGNRRDDCNVQIIRVDTTTEQVITEKEVVTETVIA